MVGRELESDQRALQKLAHILKPLSSTTGLSMAGGPIANTRASASKGSALRLDHVRKCFGDSLAVDDVSLSIEAGTFLTILGASGSGKSTTLMLIAGFLDPDSGAISVDGQSIVGKPPFKRDFGVVFQNYALFPHMSVFDNVAFPLKMRRQTGSDAAKAVRAALDLVKLEGFDSRLPKQLSGGQQQRVALARAIVARAKLLLMDEPLSALDKQLREHMQLELKSIHQSLGVTVVYVTHDQEEALVMSDQVAVMRNGRVEQIGSPQAIYDQPANRFVAEFIGESNFLPAKVLAAGGGQATLQLTDGTQVKASSPLGARPGDTVTATIRPERLRVRRTSPDGQPTNGVVETINYLGDSIRIQLRLASGSTMTAKAARSPEIDSIRRGDAVSVAWNPSDLTVLASS